MATRLQLLIDGDASGAKRALDDTAKSVGTVDGRMGKFNGAMKAAAVPAAAVLTGLVAIGKASFDSASALEQSAGAVESVFGTYAAQVQQHAASAAQNVGLAESQYNDLSAVLGAQLQNMGVAQGELAGQTDNLIGLGSDLAATFGGTTSDAVAALSSLMRGERDPIEKYGVSIKAADVEAKKAAMGLNGLTGEADNAATTQATLALVMEQTAGAQGAFAREANTAAGQQQRATASWENAKAALGQGLLPIVSSAAAMLAEFGTWVQENAGLVSTFAVVIGVLAAGVLAYNGIMAVVSTVQGVATAAQWACNAAVSANPVMLIVLAIVALIAIIVLLVQNWDTVKAVALSVWQAITDAVQVFLDWCAAAWQAFVDAHVALWNNITDAAGKVWQAITDAVQTFLDWCAAAWQAFVDAHVALWNSIKDAAEKVWQAITATTKKFVDWVDGAARSFADAHIRAWNTIEDGAATAWRAVTNTVKSFFDWIGGAVDAIPDAFRNGFQRAADWVSSFVARMWSELSGFIDRIASIPRRIQSALSNVQLPSWVQTLTGVLGFSTTASAYYASTLTASAWEPRGWSGTGDGPRRGGDISIVVQGAIDPPSVVRQLRELFNSDARIRGAVDLAGVVIR